MFHAVCCLFLGLSTGNGHTATIGSGRPVVQKNFQQLIKTNRCPGCDLAGAVLTRVDLSGADLSGANLSGAKCNLTDFSGANLRGANLQGAILGGADLAGADLTGANLTGAILQGAYLKGAKLDGTLKEQGGDQGGLATGETVFVPDGAKSKHAPYTQEADIEKQGDRGKVSSSASLPEAKQPPVAPAAGSKHPVSMADAVVPVATETTEAGKSEKEKAVVLREQKKQPVAAGRSEMVTPEKAEVKPSSDTRAAGVDENSAVHDMIARIEADAPGKESGELHKKNHKKDIATTAEPDQRQPEITEEKSGSVANMEPQATTVKKAASPEQPVKPVPATAGTEERTGEAATPAVKGKSAADTHAFGDAAAQNAGAKEAGPLLYTVQTPAQAAAAKQQTVERLLDTDACVECDLAGVDLSGKRLKGVDLERANLAGANLSDTNLAEANLKGANLSGANLRDADLSEADLYKADLTGADLTGADLTEAATDSADLTDAKGVPPAGDNK